MNSKLKSSHWLLLITLCLFLEFPVVHPHKSLCCGKSLEVLQCHDSTVIQVPKPFPNKAGWCPGITPPNGKEITKLDMSGSDVAKWRNDVFDDYPNVLTLRMDNCNISVLEANACCQSRSSSRLQNISLRNSKIKHLNVDAFAGLASLRYIHLGENQLESLPTGIFAHLVKLTELWLKGNRLTRIDTDHFNSSVSLKKLDLSANVIETLEPFSASLNHLEELYLENNKITELDSNLLKNLRTLTLIDLSNNKLATIDENFFGRNTDIYWIDLKNNALTHLPRRTFQHLCKLSWLDIGNNNLSTPYFEWFANVVHQSKFFSSKTISYPLNSGNRWNCDCDAALYADFIAVICKDSVYRGKKLMDYLSIKCSTGNQIVERISQSCHSRTLTNCRKDTRKAEQTKKGTCTSTPSLCRFLTTTCGGNREDKRSKLLPQKPTRAMYHPLTIFGGVILSLSLIGLLLYGRKKLRGKRKRHESDTSSKGLRENSDDEMMITFLSESDGYENDADHRPTPVGASEHSSSTQSMPRPDSFYDSTTDDSTEPLIPNCRDTKYDSEHEEEDTSSTRPKSLLSPGENSTTIPKQLYSGPDIIVTRTEVRIPMSFQKLENDYTPMRSLLDDVLGRTIHNDETVNGTTSGCSSNTFSYLPGHKYETVPNTCDGYEMPIRQSFPPSLPHRKPATCHSSSFRSQFRSKNNKATKKKLKTKLADVKSGPKKKRRK